MVRYGACHRAALRADPLASPGMTATREGRRTTSRLAFRLISQEPSDAPSAGRRRAWSREAGISCLLLLQRSSLFGHGFQRSQRLQFGVECVFQQTLETALVLAFADLNFLFHCTLHSHFQTTTRAEIKGSRSRPAIQTKPCAKITFQFGNAVQGLSRVAHDRCTNCDNPTV
jgi:hypothetical protein